jgi:hypothetical protein
MAASPAMLFHIGSPEAATRAGKTQAARLELFPLPWNQLSSWMHRIFDGEPDPLRRKML